MSPHVLFLPLALLIGATVAPPALHPALVVKVTGLRTSSGEIGCALFPGAGGFPMDNRTARVQWLPADTAGVRCRFEDVPPGEYAVSVSHDLNGNRKTDTNFLGIPTEAWGVSNHVRPRLRAPRFEEARFSVSGTEEMEITVEVAK